MTIEELLSSCPLARIDAEVLLAHALGVNRSRLVAHSGDMPTERQVQLFQSYVDRREQSEPVAYITGSKEFYGREFYVDERVLIPRPSTEGLVDAVLQFLEDGDASAVEVDTDVVVECSAFGDVTSVQTIVDVGTGSGCIAVTLALERPDLHVIATDLSEDALEVAKSNAERLGVIDHVSFRQGNLLEPLDDLDEHFIVVSNPPYIPVGEPLMRDVEQFEPEIALFDSGAVDELIEACSANQHCFGLVVERRVNS